MKLTQRGSQGLKARLLRGSRYIITRELGLKGPNNCGFGTQILNSEVFGPSGVVVFHTGCFIVGAEILLGFHERFVSKKNGRTG